VFDIVITSFETEIEYWLSINPKINYQLITLPNRFPNLKTFSGSGLLGSDRASFGLSVLMLPDDLKEYFIFIFKSLGVQGTQSE
jgi:hypothetical protein